MAIELEDKFFHGIKSHCNSYGFEKETYFERLKIRQIKDNKIILTKLKSIFECKKLLSREAIDSIYLDHEYKYSDSYYDNSDETVSLSDYMYSPVNYYFDEDTETFRNSEYDYNLIDFHNRKSKDSFKNYILNGVSLIFSNDLKNEALCSKQYNALVHEVLFKNEVTLDYLVAIGFSTIDAMICRPFFNLSEYSFDYLDINVQKEHYKFLKELISLLKTYKVDVPIVSIENGCEYQSNDDYEQKILKYNSN